MPAAERHVGQAWLGLVFKRCEAAFSLEHDRRSPRSCGAEACDIDAHALPLHTITETANLLRPATGGVIESRPDGAIDHPDGAGTLTTPNLLIQKLELFGPLPEIDRQLLDEVVSRPRQVEHHQDLLREGDEPNDVHLVLEGFACRYKLLPAGKRSIFAYLVPGDFCDLNTFILKAMDHSIATLSTCTVVDIPRSRILEMSDRPAIVRALWWATLVDEATLREWLVNIGRRDAESSIAHLFCEIHLRMKHVDLADDFSFRLPVTQDEIGDTVGLSTVHVNRSIHSLHQRRLCTMSRGTIMIHDMDALYKLCGFNPSYLHLTGGKVE